ncbi:MAG: hypothetical protein AABX48_01380 [Nanoarchaeota archaeon]
MIEIKTRIRKWGNSLGIVVPLNSVKKENVKEGDKVSVFMKKEDKGNILRETFGTMKFKRTVEKMMREMDNELYNE